MTKIIELSTQELYEMVDKQDTIIIDARPVDAYNGWTLENEIRGGHIKSAKALPAKWTSYMDLIGDGLKKEGIDYLRLDGSTRKREDVVKKFK